MDLTKGEGILAADAAVQRLEAECHRHVKGVLHLRGHYVHRRHGHTVLCLHKDAPDLDRFPEPSEAQAALDLALARTPADERTARAMASTIRARPVQAYEAPRLTAPPEATDDDKFHDDQDDDRPF